MKIKNKKVSPISKSSTRLTGVSLDEEGKKYHDWNNNLIIPPGF